MNERPAKIAVICHMLFTLASLLLAIYFFLFVPGKGIVPHGRPAHLDGLQRLRHHQERGRHHRPASAGSPISPT